MWVLGSESKSSGRAELSHLSSPTTTIKLPLLPNKNKVQESGSELPRVPRVPPPTNCGSSSLTFPLPAGPMTSCAYRGMPAVRVPTAAGHTPFSLRETPPASGTRVRANRSADRLFVATARTTECPKGRITCETRTEKKKKREKAEPRVHACAERELRSVVGWATGGGGCLGDSGSRVTLRAPGPVHRFLGLTHRVTTHGLQIR